MITREADYAIRTVLYLSEKFAAGPISTTEIGESMDIPYRFLRKITRKLIDNKLVCSVRGKQGGVFLSKQPHEIDIYQILEIFDQRAITFNSCCKPSPDICNRKSFCPVHGKLIVIQEKMGAMLKEFTFDDLID